MIITDTTSSPVITNITAAPSRFKIKASAKAFKILSGFYSEPILAIPRELGANAWDSHVKAGNTKTMFEVHAPNQLEPWFSVRDFGTGLSTQDIDTIYTTYFESTKTNENDSDGCMGLGSKTPFNYTDNFNVTSWFKGKKHVYNCFIDESGSPNIMHVVSEDSTEHPGLEIKFGVKISDISMWVDKIARAYEPFRYRPVIKGAVITYPAREYIHEGKTWGHRKTETGYNSYSRSSGGGCYAFMGNYCYPVSVSAFRSALYNQPNGGTLETALNRGSFDFFFDIGQLEVAPNKEQLQYEDNNPTTLALIEAVKIAVKELKTMVLKSVEVPKTLWEAMNLHQKYNSYNSPYQCISNVIGAIPIMFNGVEITSNNESLGTTHRKAGVTTVSGTAPQAAFTLFVLDSIHGKMKRTGTYAHHGVRKALFFYANQETIKNARLRYYLNTKYGTGNAPISYIVSDLSAKNVNFLAHKKYFGWDDADVIDIEALPKPPATPRAKRTATTDEIRFASLERFITPKPGYRTCVAWGSRAETFDGTKTYYYIDFLYYDPVYKDVRIDHDTQDNIVKVFVDNKLNDGADVIYGINKKNRRLLRVGKWVNITEAVKKHVAANKTAFEQSYFLANYARELLEKFTDTYNKLYRISDSISKITSTKTKHALKNFIAVYDNAKLEEYLGAAFYKLVGVTATKHVEPPLNLTSISEMFNVKYMGIIDLVGNNYSDDAKTKSVYKIINFIDEKS